MPAWMTRRWKTLAFVTAAIAAALGAFTLLRPRPEPPPTLDADLRPPVSERPRQAMAPLFDPERRGGTFGGVVLGPADEPVVGARVHLVGLDTKAKVYLQPLDPSLAPESIPDFGNFRTVGEPVLTDSEGRFIAYAGDYAIAAIAVFHPGYGPGLRGHTKEHPLEPGPDHVIRLRAAGRFKGKVIDAVTKEPIHGADVEIQVQSIANRGRPGPGPWTPDNLWPMFQQWFVREFGPRAWDITPRAGESGLHVTTKTDGTFEVGPVMEDVQLEFVITHGDYKWEDTDPEVVFPEDNPPPKPGEAPRDKPIGRKQRTVVPAGQTIERTFGLVRGNQIAGKVVDERDQPIERVRVVVEHVLPYAQHHYYRTHYRFSFTDADGKFRVAGLDRGPYVVRLEHDSFGTEYKTQVQENSMDNTFVVPTAGWIVAQVDGGPADAPSYVARVVLDPVKAESARREEKVRVEGGKFTVPQVRPGLWRVWAETATLVSAPVEVRVEPTQAATVSLTLGAGGLLRVVVRDSAGRAVDPATLDLEVVEGDKTRRGARFVGRAGVVEGRGVLPGRYRAQIRGMGFLPVRTEEFEVRPEATVDLGVVTARREAYVQIAGVRRARGGAIQGECRTFVNDVERRNLASGRVQVEPGRVTVRVECDDGSRFERAYEVGEGETVPVEIVLE